MNDQKIKRLEIDYEPGIWRSWVGALTHPGMLLHAVEETFNSFVSTRPWRRLLLFSPALLVVFTALGLILYGRSISRVTLVERYGELAEKELERINQTSDGTDSGPAQPVAFMAEEKSSSYSDMLYRRLLHLNDQNARTRYVVAMQMARSQRTAQARQLMEEIAGSDASGYPAAHAWLAIDLLSRQPLSKPDQAKLMRHLSVTARWEGAGAAMLNIYAQLLASSGQRKEALDVMELAAKKDPRLQAKYALLARQLKMPKIANEMTVKARATLTEAINKPDAPPQTYVDLVMLELAEENFNEALSLAQKGLNTVAKDSDQLKYLASETLRLMYRKSIVKTENGMQLDLRLLDEAMKVFPANPNIATEIALLDDMGVDAAPAFKTALEQQLANGQATALAHLVLANQDLKAGRLVVAIPHLELSLKQAPNHPVALNNLAMALSLTDTSKVERAEELIAKAIAIDPRNPEFYDSQGQIRMIAGRPLDAVESFEKAIGINPRRVNTRQMMVNAYREAGLADLALAQEKALERLQSELDQSPSNAEAVTIPDSPLDQPSMPEQNASVSKPEEPKPEEPKPEEPKPEEPKPEEPKPEEPKPEEPKPEEPKPEEPKPEEPKPEEPKPEEPKPEEPKPEEPKPEEPKPEEPKPEEPKPEEPKPEEPKPEEPKPEEPKPEEPKPEEPKPEEPKPEEPKPEEPKPEVAASFH